MATLSIILPQRCQAVNGDSPLEAGIHFLPLTIALPVGSFVGNIIFAVLPKVPPSVFLLAGSAMELIGAGLLVTLPSSASASLPASQYGFQILTGFGAGVVFSILMMVTPRCVEARDLGSYPFSLFLLLLLRLTTINSNRLKLYCHVPHDRRRHWRCCFW